MADKARHFPNLTTEYLDTHVNLKVAPPNSRCTCCAWVQIDSAFGNPDHAIYGAMNGVETAGFLFKISDPLGGGKIVHTRGSLGPLQASSVAITTAGNFADKPWFVAVTIETAVGVHFYAGSAPADVVEISLVTGGDAFSPVADPPDADFTVHIGGNHHGSPVFSNQPMGGVIDQVGLWYGHVLSLDQLKTIADCQTPSTLMSTAKFFYPITGQADFEPDLSPASSGASIIGTTVVDGLCHTAPAPQPPASSPKPPPAGGGVGGGLGNRTDEFAALIQVSNVREVKPPLFGVTHTTGAGLLSQRIHPRFRGLDHLAETIKHRGRR